MCTIGRRLLRRGVVRRWPLVVEEMVCALLAVLLLRRWFVHAPFSFSGEGVVCALLAVGC